MSATCTFTTSKGDLFELAEDCHGDVELKVTREQDCPENLKGKQRGFLIRFKNAGVPGVFTGLNADGNKLRNDALHTAKVSVESKALAASGGTDVETQLARLTKHAEARHRKDSPC